MGPSGSGKTTLLNILSTIDKPTQGIVALDGQDVTQISNKELSKLRKDKIGFVFQVMRVNPLNGNKNTKETKLFMKKRLTALVVAAALLAVPSASAVTTATSATVTNATVNVDGR